MENDSYNGEAQYLSMPELDNRIRDQRTLKCSAIIDNQKKEGEMDDWHTATASESTGFN